MDWVAYRHPPEFSSKMVDVRDPVGVDSIDDGPTTAVRRSDSAQVVVGGGLLVALLVVLAVSVIWVSHDSKHPLVQPNPPPPTTSAPTSTVTAAPIPPPASATQQAPPVDTPTAPVEAWSPSQVTAETMAPAPPPMPRLPTLHELFPRLFPSE